MEKKLVGLRVDVEQLVGVEVEVKVEKLVGLGSGEEQLVGLEVQVKVEKLVGLRVGAEVEKLVALEV